MALIIPKNNADAQTLDATLRIYYEAKDWVQNAVLIDKLSSSLKELGIEKEKKEPQSYTKKTQVLAYFGFITWQDVTNEQSDRRITELGKQFYEARQSKDKDNVIAILIKALTTCTFGRNVIGCNSDSDIEAPNVFIKGSLLLGGLSNNEFAYILGRMEYDGVEFSDAILYVKKNRLLGIKTIPDEKSKKWNDPKPITALKNWGFFNGDDNSIDDVVIKNHADELLRLRTKNNDALKFRFPNEENNLSIQNETKFYPYLSALRTKPFVLLAGISGTGKSRIVRKLAQATNPKTYAKEEDRWKDNRPDNFELIQVKPNWHNSMDVTGFYSSVSKRYEFTPFVRFIVKAWQHLDTPYFLCLDEMNLAPVEEYFAEFLSAIESRSFDKNSNYITDPIIKPFNEFEDEVKSKMLNELFKGKEFTEGMRLAEQFSNSGLTLPPNLMVMGTVNMDETTFTFSRKVLDRAMSIEMNEVNYDAFLTGETEAMPLLCDYNPLLVDRPQKASKVKDNVDSQRVIEYLKSINALLEGTPFKLGYRAANEAILYVAACQDFAGDGFKLENALDEFTLMKILSRIEGDDSRLTLNDNDERLGDAGVTTADLLDDEESNPNLLHGLRAIVRKHISLLSETEKKINIMLKTLEREHFVSYWN